MSKFIDELRRVSQVELQPMGFRAVSAAPLRPRMLLVATLAQVDVDRLADYVAGADAGLLEISALSSGVEAVQQACQARSDIPWGGWLRSGGQGEIKELVEAGCDFVVFPAAVTSLAVAQSGEVGRVLEVDALIPEGLLKAVDDLPVDAVLIAGGAEKDYSLTWRHLMLFRRCASLLTKPLLVSVPGNVVADELQALWEAGINGVVVEVGVEPTVGRLAELHQIIDRLSPPSPPRRRKLEPLLPQVGEEREAAPEEEEE